MPNQFCKSKNTADYAQKMAYVHFYAKFVINKKQTWQENVRSSTDTHVFAQKRETATS